MRRQAEWNVETHIFSAGGPTSSATRERISSAALLVNVMARIPHGGASPVARRWAMRRVRTRVLPEPAPAMMSNGPPRCSTAARWGMVRSSRSAAGRPENAPVAVGGAAAPSPPVVGTLQRGGSRCGLGHLRVRSRHLRRGGCAHTLVGGVEQLAGLAVPRGGGHSHSMVPGGFDVTSSATRFTPSTSLMMREAMRSTRS